MDKITIRKSYCNLTTKNIGTAYNVSFSINKESQNFKYKLFRNIDSKGDDAYLVVIINDCTSGFTINGSIRKWWFGKNSFKDFNKFTFCQCIEHLAERLEVPIEDFWYCRVTLLEVGGNVKLPRKYDHIISSMISFPRLSKESSVANETKKFLGTDVEIIAYDKIKEVLKKSKMKTRLANKIINAFFVMRFEIKLKTPSRTVLKYRVNTLQNIKDNWEFIIDYWENAFNKIEIVEKPIPTQMLCKKYSRRGTKDFFSVIVANKFGIRYVFKTIESFSELKKKSAEKKHFVELCKKYESENFFETKNNVIEAVKNKAKLMKHYCPN